MAIKYLQLHFRKGKFSMNKSVLTACVLCCLVAGAGATASAQTSARYSEKLDCVVASVSSLPGGNASLGSYVPPTLGSKITLDFSRSLIRSLDFHNQSMIPVLHPLQRVGRSSAPSYIATFRSEQSNSSMERSTLVVTGGIFSGIRRATIQFLSISNLTELVEVNDTVYLDCQLSR